MPSSLTPGSSSSHVSSCATPTRPSPRSERLGTPKTPAIRSTRGSSFEASLVRICYGLSGCSPPWTDLTEFPQPPGAFTSRLPTGWSPVPPLDMTTTDGVMGLAWMSCAVRWSSPDRMEVRGHGSRCAPAPSIAGRRTTMEHHAGLDVSLNETSVCIVDGAGKIIRETQVASEPEALVGYFSALEIKVVCIGLEAGPLSQWLHAGLTRAGFEVVLLETRHVKAALSAMTVKTDRKDARGIAQLLRMGWFRAVHAKSMGSQEVRALLVARKQLLGRLIDVELSIRGILRGFGLKIGPVTRKGFELRIRELVTGQATLERIAGAMLSARAALKAEYEKLHKAVLAIVREDAVCRRLMTVPSGGPLVAITFKSAMDDPSRIAKSKAAGALFGLTPKKYQSGEKDVTGGITLAGDEMVRTVLYEAANVLLSRITRFSKLKRWGMDIAKRRGSKRAKVALARKLAVILHRIWVDGTTYRWGEARPIAA